MVTNGSCGYARHADVYIVADGEGTQLALKLHRWVCCPISTILMVDKCVHCCDTVMTPIHAHAPIATYLGLVDGEQKVYHCQEDQAKQGTGHIRQVLDQQGAIIRGDKHEI